MRPDWPSLRLEYILSNVTQRELAQQHGLKERTVNKRAEREHWAAEREERQRGMIETASQQVTFDAVAELRRQNLFDLDCARRLRQHIERLLHEAEGKDDLSPSDLRTLSAALESTQRVCRLALGASSNNEVVVKHIGKQEVEHVSIMELFNQVIPQDSPAIANGDGEDPEDSGQLASGATGPGGTRSDSGSTEG
jgi:hypothetical protein